jgi:hypothetical protein
MAWGLQIITTLAWSLPGKDAFGNGQIGEIFQVGEPVRTGLDGIPNLVQELADVAPARPASFP